MRIIAGLFRGRKIKSLRGMAMRPTPERLRETLFDVLGKSVEGSTFVDAYAGTGAIGIEALSRGARYVSLVEENPAAVRLIHENLLALGIRDRTAVVCASVHNGLRLVERRGAKAGFCFLDPPYAEQGEYFRSLRWLGNGHLMAPDGWIIFQHSRNEALPEQAGRLNRVRLLTQGSNVLSFYRPIDSDHEPRRTE